MPDTNNETIDQSSRLTEITYLATSKLAKNGFKHLLFCVIRLYEVQMLTNRLSVYQIWQAGIKSMRNLVILVILKLYFMQIITYLGFPNVPRRQVNRRVTKHKSLLQHTEQEQDGEHN